MVFPSRLKRYCHALVSFETFVASICFSGEYRVPARSRLNMGQSRSA